ncbi:MAG TPA: OmpW family outer membrane protein [Thermoanaerobaculia bacterium]|nr:OmpW family outer membrane protein [Thermoanaerobaculia bacterium]
MTLRNTLLLLACVSLLAVPASAQERYIDFNVFAAWANPSGDSAIQFSGDVNDLNDVEFDAAQGWGVSVNIFWSDRISTEFAGSVIDPELRVRDIGRTRVVFAEPLEMIPITATLQFHLLPGSRFDPYVGVGAGYVIFQDIEDRNDLDEIDFDRIDFEDDVGLVLNAGVRIGFTRNLGLYLDAKYMPLEAAATAVFPGGENAGQEIEINPLILAAGLSFSF